MSERRGGEGRESRKHSVAESSEEEEEGGSR